MMEYEKSCGCGSKFSKNNGGSAPGTIGAPKILSFVP